MTDENNTTADAQQDNQSGGVNAEPKKAEATYTQEQLDSMVSARTDRAEKSVLKSFFAQQGMTEDEITQAISAYKSNREKNKPDTAALQAELLQLKASNIKAQIDKQAVIEAVKLGVAPNTIGYVLKLADFGEAADKDGGVSAEKLQEAINKVLTDVPQFKTKADSQKGFTKIGSDSDSTQKQADNDILRLRRSFGLKTKS